MTQDKKDTQLKTPGEGSSMEDILSSIRQAMSETLEDNPHHHMEEEKSFAPSNNTSEPDVLDLHTTSTPPQKRPTWAHPEKFDKPLPAAKPRAAEEAVPHSLLSQKSETLTRKALDTLDEQIQRNRALEMEQSYLAIEKMLRPILKQWCEQHLPEIVTRSVEVEVRKLVTKLSQGRHG